MSARAFLNFFGNKHVNNTTGSQSIVSPNGGNGGFVVGSNDMDILLNGGSGNGGSIAGLKIGNSTRLQSKALLNGGSGNGGSIAGLKIGNVTRVQSKVLLNGGSGNGGSIAGLKKHFDNLFIGWFSGIFSSHQELNNLS